MTPTPLYTYRLSGRRPATFFAFFVSLALLVAVASYALPWYFYVPLALSVAMSLWAIIADPQTGSELSAETLHFFNRHHKDTIRIADIASMKVTNWTDGPDTVALTLKSGRVVHIPSMCADSKLGPALRELGVAEAKDG